MGLTSRNPGRGSLEGLSESVMVSPILVSAGLLRFGIRYPTLPALSSSHGRICGLKKPTSLISLVIPLLKSLLFPEADQQPSSERLWLKKLLADCRGCGKCILPQTQFFCPYSCPKKLFNGPCGEVTSDGICPADGNYCVHLAIWQEAEQRRERYHLESSLIDRP